MELELFCCWVLGLLVGDLWRRRLLSRASIVAEIFRRGNGDHVAVAHNHTYIDKNSLKRLRSILFIILDNHASLWIRW